MTLTTTIVKKEYVGNGATRAFATDFQFWDDTEIDVILRTIATGVEVLQTLNNQYTVSGGAGATGTVTFNGPTPVDFAPLSTVEVHLRRATVRDQQTDFTPRQNFPSAKLQPVPGFTR